MWSTHPTATPIRGVSGVVMVAALALVASGAGQPESKAGGTPAGPAATAPPVVRETRKSLLEAFDDEINVKTRYQAAAKIAEGEGYPDVARLFRACARAEEVHAGEHVHAIAWSGDEARAVLERLALGTTVENLRVAIDLETYEATQRYPALLAQARAEHMTAAVRSMNFALAAEREHGRLFTAALETLEQRPAPRTFHVCPTCGKTTTALDFKKCPNCFTAAKKFIQVD